MSDRRPPGERVRILLLCATQRGVRFLSALNDLVPDAEIRVVTFREDPREPRYVGPLRALAAELGASFSEARDLTARSKEDAWLAARFDLLLAVNWRYFVRASVYGRARLGSFVFHDSLLPQYRGFSPTVWAMINGEDHTGVTLFHMSEEIDAGDIVDQMKIPISPRDTIADVTERVTVSYLEMARRNIALLLSGSAPRRAQDESRATYTCKRTREDDRIDWKASTRQVRDLIRAVTRPYPGAHTSLDGRRLTVWSARELAETRPYVGRVPGRVVERRPGEGIVVLTGDGALLVQEAQLQNDPPALASEVITSISTTLGR